MKWISITKHSFQYASTRPSRLSCISRIFYKLNHFRVTQLSHGFPNKCRTEKHFWKGKSEGNVHECVVVVTCPLCIHLSIRITESLCHIANAGYEGASIRLSFSWSLSSPILPTSLICLSLASTLTLCIIQLHYRRTSFPKFGKLGICKPVAEYSSVMKAVCAISQRWRPADQLPSNRKALSKSGKCFPSRLYISQSSISHPSPQGLAARKFVEKVLFKNYGLFHFEL
jgi:hypothetical protein